ncbi:amidohydrolase family protein [Sphingobium sp. MK2]|uniref:amidohydrolase family protein n=1 Tax=Sphingobium sp. MK2 TaxID=3116540 RepID=UPI0032E36594
MTEKQTRPIRGQYLVRGGHIISMDDEAGDFPSGDVLIDDGRIIAVGNDIDAADAEVIDAADMIVMPGFVEVHWHMWNCIWRGLSHDAPGYFALHRLAPDHSSEDHYNAVRMAAVEALSAGVTTCHNWANALRGREDAVAEANALVDTGIRARFGYGSLMPQTPEDRAADIAAMQAWIDQNGEGLMDLGVVCHQQGNLETDIALARAMGLKSIAPHVNLAPVLDILGPDFIFTHGPGISDQMIALLKEKGVKIGLCPATDPMIGAGMPPLQQFLQGGIPFEDIAYSVDVSSQTSVDPFAAMRTILHASRIAQMNGASFDEIIFSIIAAQAPFPTQTLPREVLKLATINGARVLGIADQVGSLTPGKRADIILLRTSDLNMLSVAELDPALLVVHHGQPYNVDTVLVDGRILKRGGHFTHVNVKDVMHKAALSQRRVQSREASHAA